MIILGIKLRRPSFDELTKCAVAATVTLVLLVLVCSLIGYTPRTSQKVAWFTTAMWGCVSSACGISISRGWRHGGLFLVVAMILGIAASATVDVFGQ